jgi:hypothetical protein
MTPIHASIELNRARLKQALRDNKPYLVKLLLGIIVGQRICAGEIRVKLKPPDIILGRLKF